MKNNRCESGAPISGHWLMNFNNLIPNLTAACKIPDTGASIVIVVRRPKAGSFRWYEPVKLRYWDHVPVHQANIHRSHGAGVFPGVPPGERISVDNLLQVGYFSFDWWCVFPVIRISCVFMLFDLEWLWKSILPAHKFTKYCMVISWLDSIVCYLW